MKMNTRRDFLRGMASAAALVPAFGVLADEKKCWPPAHGHVLGLPSAYDNPLRRQNRHLPDRGLPAPSFDFNARGEFVFLQATDMHWSKPTMGDRERRFYAAVCERCSPSLAVITGDNVNIRWKGESGFDGGARAIVSLFTENRVPFAVTLGNHDAEYTGENYYTAEEQWEIYRSLGGRFFCDYNVPSLCGCANGVIHLKKDGATKFDVYVMDTGDYGPFDVKDRWNEYDGYDGVRRAQLDWVQKQLQAKTPSLFFQHIPVQELKDLSDDGGLMGRGLFRRVEGERATGCAPGAGDCTGRETAARNCGAIYEVNPKQATGRLGEPVCPTCSRLRRDPRYLTTDGKSEYDLWRENRCVKGAYFGHDHANSYDGVTTDGVRLGATTGSTSRSTVLFGVRVFTVRADGTYDTKIVTEKEIVS